MNVRRKLTIPVTVVVPVPLMNFLMFLRNFRSSLVFPFSNMLILKLKVSDTANTGLRLVVTLMMSHSLLGLFGARERDG